MALKDKLVDLEDLKAAYDNLKGMIDAMSVVETVSVPVSGTNVSSDSFCNATKCGSDVVVDLCLRLTTFDTQTNMVVATLPSGYRPTQFTSGEVIRNSSGTGRSVITIAPNGGVTVLEAYGVDPCYAHISFLTDD